MKFGALDFGLTVEEYWRRSWNHKALLNIGDAAEYMVVEQIYRSLGVEEDQVVRLSIPQLTEYRGESLILPLNIALDSYVGYNRILSELSPDIIPVFLGMSFTVPELSKDQIECLRAYAPVGCRDERSYRYMKSLHIPCYLNGCTAAVLQADKQIIPEVEGKIVLIDVPYGVLKYIPEELKADLVFLQQEVYCRKSELEAGYSPVAWARKILAVYDSAPKLIVTSRFHGAVLALSKDIPAIITLEKYTFRFSWLKNYYPIYTEDNFDRIDWAPKKIDCSSVRKLILQVAQMRIKETNLKYKNLLALTDLQKCGSIVQEQDDCSNHFFYYRRAWEKLQSIWDHDGKYEYSFWGVNHNAEVLFSLISQEYPKARLVDVYDMYQEVSFAGLTSRDPHDLKEYADRDDYFVISTAYLASRVVPDICHETGFSEEYVVRCERDFIDPTDIVVL